jgi:hypothetical protein
MHQSTIATLALVARVHCSTGVMPDSAQSALGCDISRTQPWTLATSARVTTIIERNSFK